MTATAAKRSNKPVSQDTLDRIRVLIAEGKSAAEIGLMLGMHKRTVAKHSQVHGLGPWPGRKAEPPPSDFAAQWVGKSIRDLATHYGRSPTTVSDWCAKLGLSRPTGVKLTKLPGPPADFAAAARVMSLRELSAHFGITRERAANWRKTLGIGGQSRWSTGAKPVAAPLHIAPVDHHQRDMSPAAQAADYLRRLCAVYRCDVRGRAMADGAFWRRGTAILTDGELMERAKGLGWEQSA